MFAGLLAIEQMVKSGDALHVRRTQTEPFRNELDHLLVDPIFIRFLTQVKCRDASSHLVGVTREDLCEFPLLLLTQGQYHVSSTFRLCEAAGPITRRSR